MGVSGWAAVLLVCAVSVRQLASHSSTSATIETANLDKLICLCGAHALAAFEIPCRRVGTSYAARGPCPL
jgi:hypothetical protein